MAKSHLRLVTPNTVKTNSCPWAEAQCRLTQPRIPDTGQIEKLMKSARDNRYGHGDASHTTIGRLTAAPS